jgi:hypothetical protein
MSSEPELSGQNTTNQDETRDSNTGQGTDQQKRYRHSRGLTQGLRGIISIAVLILAMGLLVYQLFSSVIMAFGYSVGIGVRSLAAALFPLAIAIYHGKAGVNDPQFVIQFPGHSTDIYVLETGPSYARVRDFDTSEDKFGIPRGSGIRLGAIELQTFRGNNTLILLGNDLLAGVEGIRPEQLRRRNATTVDLDSFG